MTTQPAPLLTAEMATAQMWRAELDGKGINPASHYAACLKATKQALADGRTACVRVLTEGECRAGFEAWAVNNNMRNFSRREEDGEYCNGPTQAFWGVWLACARAMGAVR